MSEIQTDTLISANEDPAALTEKLEELARQLERDLIAEQLNHERNADAFTLRILDLEKQLAALQRDNARLTDRSEQLERALKLKEIKIDALEHELTEANRLRQAETDVWSSMVAEANALKHDNARLMQANAEVEQINAAPQEAGQATTGSSISSERPNPAVAAPSSDQYVSPTSPVKDAFDPCRQGLLGSCSGVLVLRLPLW